MLDAGLLRLIKVSELEQGAWMKKDKVGVSLLQLHIHIGVGKYGAVRLVVWLLNFIDYSSCVYTHASYSLV